MLEAMIFGENGPVTSSLERMCSDLKDICLYRSPNRYPEAHEAIRLLNAFAPQLVFLDLTDQAAASALESVIRGFHPATAIVAVCGDEPCARVVQGSLGPLPLLSVSCGREEFRDAVDRALGMQSGAKTAPLFTFQPAKAGSGATTTALSVANILSKQAHKKVLLMDCDLHAGAVSMLTNVHPTYSIIDALENSDVLTDGSWLSRVTTLDGLDILSSVGAQGVRRVSPWAYQRLLTFVRTRYDVVICDLPEVVNEATEEVVRKSKAVFVVTAPSTPSLHLAARRRQSLEARGVGVAKIKFVLNRKSRGQTIALLPGSFAEGDEIAAIPFDQSLMDANEFKLDFVQSATIAEYTKIAEYCSGAALAAKPQRRSLLPAWLRGAHRSSEILSQPALR